MRRFLLLSVIITALFGGQVWASETPTEPQPQVLQGHPACAGITAEVLSTPECEALMAARPAPQFGKVGVDLGIIQNVSLARFTQQEVTIYDAPDGNEIETITAGYSYVAPSNWDSNWVEIDPGRWVRRSDVRFARASDMTGVLLNGAQDMPFAWVLWRLNASSAPAGATDRSESGYYERWRMVYIYATVNVGGWDWHLVGPNHWIMQKNLSIVYPAPPTQFEGNWAAVNLFEQNLVAYSGGTPVMATLISSGVKNGRWDTNEGTFAVHSRVESGTMNGSEGAADYYSLEFVPYAQYFDELISLHGTYWHDSFGFPHSHGCVNMSVSDAKWMFDFLGMGSTVYVYSGKF